MAKGQRRLVAIYVRKSRLKDADSMEISRQLDLLTDYAEKNNMDYEVFSEEGSSEEWDRPKFQKMLMELKRKIYDGVLVTDQDRLTRDRKDFGMFVRFMKAEALQLFTLHKTYNFLNEDDVIVSGIQSEMDNHFLRMTKRKLRRGRIQAIKKGVFFGIAPYGYEKDEQKRLIPHQSEAKVVEDIYKMYVEEGLNQAEIVEQLTLRRKMTRVGKPFTVRATSLILSNVAYRGIVHYELEGEDVIHVEEAHPALVDAVTFNKAQLIRTEKRKVPQQSRRGVYFLSKKLVCPLCNQTLSFCMKYVNKEARANLDKDGRALYVLNCHASKGHKAKIAAKGQPRCKNNGVKSARIEKAVLKELRRHITDINARIEAITSGDTLFLNSLAVKQQGLTLQYNNLEEQRKRVQDGFKGGIYDTEEATEEIKKIKRAQLILEYELNNLEGADVKSEVDKLKRDKAKIEMLLSMDTEANPTKANKLLHEIIDKIWYWKEQSDVGGEKPFEISIDYVN